MGLKAALMKIWAGWWVKRISMGQTCEIMAQKVNQILGWTQSSMAAVERGDSPPLLCSGEAPPGAASQFWGPSTRETESQFRGGPQKSLGARRLLL